MKKIVISFIVTVIATSLSFADIKNHATEISENAREKVALTTLKSEPNTVQVYAKGLICESCGLGVRKKLQKLKFIDTSKPQKGIVMNVKSQLVSITLKQGQSADTEAIKKAIKGAGYDPMYLYELDGKTLKSVSLQD